VSPSGALRAPRGLSKDAGWEIGVSRTLPFPPDDVWALLTAPEGLALWLGTLDTLPGFHQERMRDAEERERQRAHWQGVMDAVQRAIEERGS
jgi:uncharacterized protein YndB with AHSA1/START domain